MVGPGIPPEPTTLWPHRGRSYPLRDLFGPALRDLKGLRGLKGLKDLKDLRDLKGLKDLRDLGELKDLKPPQRT
ncbi:hypothetical protein HEK616_05750 [Streptomyces nigrescens]|uniref:Uncharacterized protein n=1 Tax=Streptomyces nigrescens TaxID=1920 RepID=A0ABM7ZMH3_STRNI|nr:hypothetical protein HEK616_05750 [Streptomyces nigrescens]